MTDDLVAFLRARLNEDADTARRAHKNGVGRWHNGHHPAEVEAFEAAGLELYETSGEGVSDDNDETVVYDEGGRPNKEQSAHIARHDPARILADIEAKRAIVDQYAEVAENDDANSYEYDRGWANALRESARLLALPYADHPDYQAEWRP